MRSALTHHGRVAALAVATALAASAWAETAFAQDVARAAACAHAVPAKAPAYDTWNTVRPGEYADYNQRASLVRRGKHVYDTHCIGCHGVNGDGKGPAAVRLLTKPRDFTSGLYKFRSTDSGSLPLDTDLYRTIARGLPRVSMPAFPLMPEPDKLAVIQYVKTFYPKWERRKEERVVIVVPKAPADLRAPARVRRGRVVFVGMQCGTCHGNDGLGGDAVFKDVWGNPQKAFDFTRGRLKGGDDPEDIYRTFHTGLISIMPAFGGTTLAAVTREGFAAQRERLAAGEEETLAPALSDFPATMAEVNALASAAADELADRNSWDLVSYIQSLRRSTSTAAAVLPAPAGAAGGGRGGGAPPPPHP